MADHFADRLTEAIKRKGAPACVGFDPVHARLPKFNRTSQIADDSEYLAASSDVLKFGQCVLELIAPMVPVVKINIAFFEPMGYAGIDAYRLLVHHARSLGLIVIGDVKRGDIGHSSAAYAEAHVGGSKIVSDQSLVTDAVTVHSYLGSDGVDPFVVAAQPHGRGVFALVHTSNESAGQIQHLITEGGKTVAERVAMLVQDWAAREGRIGDCGYSCLGAVVAPGHDEMARKLRALMPNVFFLVPGYGAQGRSIEQVKACFKPDGTGAIVNSSRNVIYAYEGKTGSWEMHIRKACEQFTAEVADMCKA